MTETLETDVLIIGSGLAGLLAAIKLLETGAKITLVCKTGLSESNSRYAQGGIAAVSRPNSASPLTSAQRIPGRNSEIEAHIADTVKAGAGLVDQRVATEIVTSGGRLIEELSNYGVVFDHLPDGSYSLAREGGHSAARVYHHQDVTGTWICNSLIEHLKKSNIEVLEHTFAHDLLMHDGKCIGALLETKQKAVNILAKHTILATGGIGQVFSRTTNPTIATGDGIAMAYRAGAELIDMEFVQFHPTALHLSDNADIPTMLISEAVRGAGAILLDHNKERFMYRFDPAGELATRDIVSRSMYRVMAESGKEEVFLDLRPIGKETLHEHFPNILRQLKQHGIDALEQLVPVSPAAHYFMGGIKANSTGVTSIPCLYAIGECASTGLHGANRLASNSLLEAGVMALNVAEVIAKDQIQPSSTSFSAPFPKILAPTNLSEMRRLTFAKAGVIRDQNSLMDLISKLENNISTAEYSIKNSEAANLLLIARLIAISALRREESRGAHYRSDYPQQSDKFAARQLVYCDTGTPDAGAATVGAGASPPVRTDDIHVTVGAPMSAPIRSGDVSNKTDQHKWLNNKDLCRSTS